MAKVRSRVAVSIIACTLLVACSRHRSATAVPGARGLGLVQHVEVLDTLVREPMLVEHPSGALFVAGYNRVRPRLWKSADRGATWTSVDVGAAAQGAIGNSDVDLAVAPDGTLYFASLTYDNRVGEGVQVAVGVSRDVGKTWRWTTVSRVRFDDRPWIGVAPDGTAHLIWNDDRGVVHVLSRDRGETWSSPVRVHDRGGSSHLAIGRHGEVAVRIAPGAASGNKCDEGTDLVAVSTDAGATWRKFAAAGVATRTAGCLDRNMGITRWVDPLAFDATGALYSLWTDSSGVALSRAVPGADTWTTWRGGLAHYPGEPYALFPFLSSRNDSVLVGTWILQTGSTLNARVAYFFTRAGAAPTVSWTALPPIESARDGKPDPAGEYFAVKLLRDGSIGMVTPIQNAAANRLGFAWWRFELR